MASSTRGHVMQQNLFKISISINPASGPSQDACSKPLGARMPSRGHRDGTECRNSTGLCTRCILESMLVLILRSSICLLCPANTTQSPVEEGYRAYYLQIRGGSTFIMRKRETSKRPQKIAGFVGWPGFGIGCGWYQSGVERALHGGW